MKIRLRKQRGVTLIELVVAVVVIAVLTAIALPSYTQYVQRSARAEARTALQNARQFMERYYTTNNGYTTFSAASNPGAFFSVTSGDNPASAYYNLQAVACTSGQATTACVELQAVPGGARNWTDATCGTLAIDTAGNTASIVGGVRTSPAPAACWSR